jgi:hypothetical protein
MKYAMENNCLPVYNYFSYANTYFDVNVLTWMKENNININFNMVYERNFKVLVWKIKNGFDVDKRKKKWIMRYYSHLVQ